MRYFLAFLIGLGVIILVLIFLIKLIFGGGGEPATPQTNLVDYSHTNVVMRLTIDGPVVADQDHRQVQIEVGQTQNELRMITGYQGHVVKNQTVDSNDSSYANFLRAIDLQGYTLGNKSEKLEDYRGYCPEGNRYIYEILDGSSIKQQYWSTSCKGAQTFKGQATTLIDLFQKQIPDYSNILGDFGLQS
jgi:hypothetical protein